MIGRDRPVKENQPARQAPQAEAVQRKTLSVSLTEFWAKVDPQPADIGARR